MSRHGIPIGRLFGISIDLDYSWFLIVALLTWMLAASYYPTEFPGWTNAAYWGIGFVTALLLFVSVLVHELAHSLVAQHYGIPVPRITLFLFGGVSQIATEPPGAASEFWIAIAGPITSLVIAAICWEMEPLFTGTQLVFALVEYLALLNLILALFNLIPGFPLDGGRVFRALIWKSTRNYHRATVAAGMSGRFFGFLLIFLGIWQALTGDIAGGIWIAVIGWFLESAAGSQLQQESVKSMLGAHTVADAMQRDFPRMTGDVSVQELVEHYLVPSNAHAVVVTAPDGTTGVVTLTTLRNMPREMWPYTMASQAMTPLRAAETTRPTAILWSALEKMGRGGANQLPVVDETGVVGMLSREDILHYMSVLQHFQGWKAASGSAH
ncbi:MAG TPA: site-2 protease family protein [Terracidiphilus sp.]|nr:site-2 protease family protein [Terracidiphilus sp.]